MKKLMTIVFFSCLLVGLDAINPQRTKGGFAGSMLGGAIGASMASKGSDSMASESIILTAPYALDRVKDQLEIRQACTEVRYFSDGSGKSIRELFAFAVEQPNNFEVLKAVRVISVENLNRAIIWFDYINKNQIIPMDQFLKIKEVEVQKVRESPPRAK